MIPTTDLAPAEPLRRLSPDAAVSLLRAVHQRLDPHAVIRALWREATVLTRATGLRYTQQGEGLDVSFGGGPHAAGYTLTHQGSAIGELELYFPQPADQAALDDAGEMLALAIPALSHALMHQAAAARLAAEAPHGSPAGPRTHDPESGNDAARGALDDALVLVSLDGFDDVRTAHGEVWAQTLVQTVQAQIHDGLREADSVFQIDEGLLAVLLPQTSEDAAMDVADKINTLIAELHLEDGSLTRKLTACMGVVGARDAGSPEDVLDQARAALSEAQQAGGNTIRAYRTGSSG